MVRLLNCTGIGIPGRDGSFLPVLNLGGCGVSTPIGLGGSAGRASSEEQLFVGGDKSHFPGEQVFGGDGKSHPPGATGMGQ